MAKEKELQTLNFYSGKDLSFKVPSGDTYSIREQNLDDDETLTQLSQGDDNEERYDNLNKFIRSIIVKHPFGDKPITDEQVKKMKLNDKYFIMLKTRIHSIGAELKFSAKCPDENCRKKYPQPIKFTFDLNQYDNKFDGKSNGFEYQVKPYPGDASTGYDEFTISSGKKLRYKYLNGESEIFILQIAKENNSISDNTMLYARELSVWVAGAWQILGSLNVFSKREGIEIKSRVEQNDTQAVLAVKCTCPKCKTDWLLPFNGLKDFLLPVEI